jgi:hypothetical protein
MVERKQQNVSKSLYKIELKLLKILPYLAALFYLLNTILTYFGIDCIFFNIIAGHSLLSLIFMLLSSFVFNFCIYHRIPLYYMGICSCINLYDWYVGIPITDKELLITHLIVSGITMFVILYLYLKSRSNEKCCNNNT